MFLVSVNLLLLLKLQESCLLLHVLVFVYFQYPNDFDYTTHELHVSLSAVTRGVWIVEITLYIYMYNTVVVFCVPYRNRSVVRSLHAVIIWLVQFHPCSIHEHYTFVHVHCPQCTCTYTIHTCSITLSLVGTLFPCINTPPK